MQKGRSSKRPAFLNEIMKYPCENYMKKILMCLISAATTTWSSSTPAIISAILNEWCGRQRVFRVMLSRTGQWSTISPTSWAHCPPPAWRWKASKNMQWTIYKEQTKNICKMKRLIFGQPIKNPSPTGKGPKVNHFGWRSKYSLFASKHGHAFFGSRSRCPTIIARG